MENPVASPASISSPSLYSPFKPGRMYTPSRAIAASPAQSGGISAPSSQPLPPRGFLSAKKRQLSTLTSGLLTKISGASTSVYEDYTPSPTSNEAPRARPGAPPLASKLREGVAAAAAKPVKLVSSAAANVRDGAREASKIHWRKEFTHELKTAGETIQSTGNSIQGVFKSAVQAMDDEADAVFDGVEKGFQAISRRLSTVGSRSSRATAQKRAASSSHESLAEGEEDDEVPTLPSTMMDETTGALLVGPAESDGGADFEATAEASITNLVESVGGAMQNSVSAVTGSVEAMASGVTQDLAAMASGVFEMGDRVEERLVAAEESLLAVGGAVGGAVTQQMAMVGETLEGGIASLEGGISGSIATLEGGSAQVANAVGSMQQLSVNAVGSMHLQVQQQLSVVGEAASQQLSVVGKDLQMVGDAVNESVSTVAGAVGGGLEAVGGGLASAEGALDDAFEEVVNTMHSVVGSLADEVNESVSTVADSMRHTFVDHDTMPDDEDEEEEEEEEEESEEVIYIALAPKLKSD